jgi:tetratricopeptide (TPR) repeat protein
MPLSNASSPRNIPLKNVLVIVTLSTLLAACADMHAPDAGEGGSPVVTAAVEDPSAEGNVSVRRIRVKSQAAPVVDALPAATLTEDILFKFLSAEIAEQRGMWQAAYINMLAVAQQSRDARIARRAAEIALNAKQPTEALAAVRLWRELAPNSDEATQYYLGLVVLSDNLVEAKKILQERLAAASPSVRGVMILQLQRLLARSKNKAAAFTLLEELLTPYKPLLEAHLALAQAASVQGNFARARQEAESALSSNPASELAALTLAQVMPNKQDGARALADFLSGHPKSREVRLAYARMLVELKQYKNAQNEFKTLLADQPQDLTVLYALGLLSAQNNDLADAESYLTSYLEVLATRPDDDRDSSQALLLLAQIAEDRNDTAAALKWLDRVEPGSSYITAQTRRAQLLAKSGDLVAARKLLKELPAGGEEESAQLLLAEAQLLRNANQVPEGQEVLAAGLKRYPNNVDLLYDYAMLAEKANNLELMETTLRKVIKLAPSNQHAYNALGYSLAERNIRLTEAFTLVEKALELAPQDPFIMDSMGWVQFRLGRLQEAETLLRRAYALRNDPEIGTHLGEVLWVKGQQEDAKQLWRDASSKDPKNDTLKSTLARLQVNL